MRPVSRAADDKAKLEGPSGTSSAYSGKYLTP